MTIWSDTDAGFVRTNAPGERAPFRAEYLKHTPVLDGRFVIPLFWYTQKGEYLADAYLVTFDTAVRLIISFLLYRVLTHSLLVDALSRGSKQHGGHLSSRAQSELS